MTTFHSAVTKAAAVALAGLIGVAMAVSPASAASLPTAVTGPSTSVSYTTASLTGDVNPEGLASTWHFQYGTSTGYGLDTPSHSGGSGAGEVGVGAAVTGLTPGTVYHYRLVAATSKGTVYGADGALKTAVSPPSLALVAPTSIGDTSAVVRADINPHGLLSIWYVLYGPSTGYGLRSASENAGSGTATVAIAKTLAGLVKDRTYHYEVVVNNAAGQSVSPDATFITTGLPILTINAATNQSATGATLNGTVNPDGHNTSWYFQYGTTTSYGSTKAAQSAGAGMSPVPVSEPISGLSPQATYHYRLVAKNASGTEASPDETISTPGPTIGTSASPVTYHHQIRVFGAIPENVANDTISIYAQAYNAGSFVLLATVLTNAQGQWSYLTTASGDSTYQAMWNGLSTTDVAVTVRPAVSFRNLGKDHFSSHIAAGHSFQGKVAQLQEQRGNQWITVARGKLDKSSSTTFAPKLRHGVLHLRVALALNQASPGYGAGYSYTMALRN